MEKFWNLDLSEVNFLMKNHYSDFSFESLSDMFCSILLSVEVKITSYTKWAAGLKETPLHAIISGFTVGDTSGTSTFYDFQFRLWLSDKNNLSDPVHPPKGKPKKSDKKGEKTLLIKKVTAEEFFHSLK